MREIKFRAWSVEDKVMFYPRCNDSFMYLLAEKSSQVYPEFKDVIQQGHLQSWMNRQEYIMQYTGLKDKNGKEIYEGDILKFDAHFSGDHWYKEYREIIEFENCSFNHSLCNVGFMDGSGQCEIIGNIHETPELLNA